MVQWSRYNQGVAAGQVIWDTDGMWEGTPKRVSEFIRHYKGDEGYKGHAYSPNWLLDFLETKRDAEFKDTDQLAETLQVENWPRWFDRAGWGELISRYDAAKESADA